ncbi:sensor domain-containing diguanylate cyclase [Zavarzinia sp. CC-PAN008]|uniref:sensor domain-containing diguanylate cyclase n=1 Tax=Zavarzinia sp. CC-PAN008 TaxID=3243332 RepID=UPI003F746C2B
MIAALRRLRDRMSMKQQAGLLMALVCLTTITLMTVTAALIVRDRAIEHATAEMADLATDMANSLDRDMFGTYREIGNFASLRPLADIWAANDGVTRAMLNQLQEARPAYAWIGFAAPDGTVQVATKGMLEGKSVAERPWFKQGSKGLAALDIHEAKLLVALLGPSRDGEPFRFVDVTAPVLAADGTLKGVVGAHLSWTWAEATRDRLLARYDPALATDIWVTDAKGASILGQPFGSPELDADALAATARGPITYIDEASDGDFFAAAVATRGMEAYSGLGWRVIARRPTAAVLAGAYRDVAQILAIGLLAALASVAAAIYSAGTLTRPVRRLTLDADRAGRDPGFSGFDRLRGSSDMLALSTALRSLVRRVDFAETSLNRARAAAARSHVVQSEEIERHTQQVEALRALANTDPMTGLLNRRGFVAQAGDVLDYFKRYGRAFAVLVVDIDHFKRVNDGHGHPAGDAVIVAVGAILAEAARRTDQVARFGGEEFVVLLREVTPESLTTWAERVRAAVADGAIAIPGGGTVQVTISLGATLASPGDRDVEDIIQRADQALYMAKGRGRNQVVTLMPEPLASAAQ